MTCCAGPIVADLSRAGQVAANATHRAALLDELRGSGRSLGGGKVSYVLSVPSIHCGNCVATIEREVAHLPGVTSVRANLTLRRVAVVVATEHGLPATVFERLEDLGYPPQSFLLEEQPGRDPQLNRLVLALAVSGFATANIMLLSVSVWNGADGATRELFHFVSALIAVPAVAFGGMPFFSSAAAALKHRRVNMDVPISLGVTLATFMSLYESFIGGGHAYFDAAVSLLFFLLIGRTLDHVMRVKARSAADRLARLASKGGYVVSEDFELTYVPLADLRPGMRLRVAAGERFPVDSVVVEGVSDVDRALVTGESEPQHVAGGAAVEAGTLNLTGPVDVLASREAQSSFLSEVTEMMAAAEKGRSTYVKLADRMAQIYAPVVHVLALTSFVGWMIWTRGDWHQSLTVAVAVLIITCPCALGLAVPVAHVVSAGRLFANGILLKDGSALERLAAISGVVFDKTGTLTTGMPIVSACAIPLGQMSAQAKALALRSIHPAARALASHIDGPTEQNMDGVREFPGHGVEASHQGRRVRLGRKDWVAEIAVTQAGSESGMAFAQEGGPLYFTRVAERVRPGAGGMLAALRNRNLAVTLLSGDGREPVAAMASQLDIADWHADLKPEGKLAHLTAAAARGEKLLMVGDGLNDAPALAAAHVSMAPASASDVGRTAADFVFTRESLESVSLAHTIALATGSIVRQNFALAIAYNMLAVPLAMAGHLNPLLAAIAMSSSSIIVVANSLRLHLVGQSSIEQPAVAMKEQTA